MTSVWTREDASRIDPRPENRISEITRPRRSDLDRDRVYWDMWPIQDRDGWIADCRGRELWMALTAPDRGDPSLRHFEAKIRLLERKPDGWTDLGDVLPDRTVPYEREWAGSAVTDGTTVSLYFTAAGTAEKPGGYQQALYETHARMREDGLPVDWSVPAPSVPVITDDYQPADAHEGEAGKIKAFRDPAYFRDPADGREYLVFTASLANAQSEFNGAVGIARKDGAQWNLLPPLVHADGVNNELERAHVVFHDGRYHLFWVTQSSTFAPGLRHAPNGMYGMVADSLFGPYRPLNHSGLVLANPSDEPMQSYSWFASRELIVSSFVDFWGMDGRELPRDHSQVADRFGGVPTPLLQLTIKQDRCELLQTMDA